MQEKTRTKTVQFNTHFSAGTLDEISITNLGSSRSVQKQKTPQVCTYRWKPSLKPVDTIPRYFQSIRKNEANSFGPKSFHFGEKYSHFRQNTKS
jgi:hypothetical protein